jgi:flagellar biosynthetic protein FliQ
MTVDQAVELTRAAIALTLLIAAPIMLVAVAVGLLVSVLQAVTQLQDQTLSFVPKIIAMTAAALYLFPWVLHQMTEYSQQVFHNVPSLM